MNSIVERRIDCPFCAASITILLDLSAGGQDYIEDCEVCCRPLQIAYSVDDDELTDVRVDHAG